MILLSILFLYRVNLKPDLFLRFVLKMGLNGIIFKTLNKGTVSLILSDLLVKNKQPRFTTVPLLLWTEFDHRGQRTYCKYILNAV